MKYLVLGGAKSGKSLFAEKLSLDIHTQNITSNRPAILLYMATCPLIDDEMQARIQTHKARRSPQWQLIEKPINIDDELGILNENSTILIDCLTLWINNLMFEGLDVEHRFERLATAIISSKASIILVSNEVGMGLVPEQKIGREFRDFQGKLNQLIAQKVDKVAFVVAGMPLWVK